MRYAKKEPVIELQKLTTGYYAGSKEKHVTSGVSTSLFKGELICLIGPNGAGKSTLMRTVSGNQKPIAGNVYLEGKNVYDLSPKYLSKRLSLVLTERVSGGMLTAYEIVALGRYPYTDWSGKLKERDHQIIQEAISMTGAEELVERPLFELSDGERQKIMVARAFAQQPEVMILDEVTAFLDLPRRVEIMGLLSKMTKENNKAILLSTHDMDLALRCADRVWMLTKAGKMYEGAPEDLILEGAFQDAFNSEAMYFDDQSGVFKMCTPYHSAVSLKGKGNAVIWTQRALERNGIRTEDFAEVRIEVKTFQNKSIWKVCRENIEEEASSIHELIFLIKNVLKIEI